MNIKEVSSITSIIPCFCLPKIVCVCFKWHFLSTLSCEQPTGVTKHFVTVDLYIHSGGRAARRGWCVSGVALLTSIHETVWISELLLLEPESFSLIAKVTLSAKGISAKLSFCHLSLEKLLEGVLLSTWKVAI